jgi:hypothetical protein
MNKPPVAIGLLLCEQVIVEEGTRNITPVNCFLHRTVHRLPSELVPFIVLALFTNGRGKMPLEVVVQRLDTLEVVHREETEVRFSSPLKMVRFSLEILDCSFPVAGQYQVALFVDGELITQCPLRIVHKESIT